MTEARSKRRVLPLVFIVKSFTKFLLISLTGKREILVQTKEARIHVLNNHVLFLCLARL